MHLKWYFIALARTRATSDITSSDRSWNCLNWHLFPAALDLSCWLVGLGRSRRSYSPRLIRLRRRFVSSPESCTPHTSLPPRRLPKELLLSWLTSSARSSVGDHWEIFRVASFRSTTPFLCKHPLPPAGSGSPCCQTASPSSPRSWRTTPVCLPTSCTLVGSFRVSSGFLGAKSRIR